MTQKMLRGLHLSTSSSIAKPYRDKQPALCPQRSHVNNDAATHITAHKKLPQTHHSSAAPGGVKLFKPKNSFISFFLAPPRHLRQRSLPQKTMTHTSSIIDATQQCESSAANALV